MANKEKIIIEFDKDGMPTVKVEGVKGSGCKALTNDIEAALGKTTKTVKTREYNERPENAKHTHNA